MHNVKSNTIKPLEPVMLWKVTEAWTGLDLGTKMDSGSNTNLQLCIIGDRQN